MKNSNSKISIVDFILINLPAFMFLFGAAVSIRLMIAFPHIHFILFIVVSWWCICGTVMVLLDFKNKREKFFRLLSIQDGNGINYPIGLRSTICGLCLIFALKNRVKTM